MPSHSLAKAINVVGLQVSVVWENLVSMLANEQEVGDIALSFGRVVAGIALQRP